MSIPQLSQLFVDPGKTCLYAKSYPKFDVSKFKEVKEDKTLSCFQIGLANYHFLFYTAFKLLAIRFVLRQGGLLNAAAAIRAVG